MGFIGALADLVYVREDALRLLLSILAGYPLAAIHRTFFYNKPSKVQHYYFVFAGLLIYLFNCGFAIYHSLMSIGIAYIIINTIPGTPLSVALAHIAFLGHLLIGYWFAESATYDITWTTPFCIMTLRFIGLVMDVYDGHQPHAAEKLKPEQLKTAIMDKPGLLEIAAYGMFFSGTLVGPQFPLSRFRSFVRGEYLDERKHAVRESSIMASIQRFVAGVFFAVMHQWGTLWVSDDFFNTAEFLALPFHWKVIWNTIWFRATMYRYCIVWLLTEGAAILCGLAYNGKDSNGDDRWDGVRDIHIIKFELGSDYQSVIDSFNCGTNTFAKNHIFKRLKWMGSKYLSHLGTLFFLAVWHGYHLGYFLLFAFEFMCMVAQEQLYMFIKLGPPIVREYLSKWWIRPFTWLFGRININISMAFAFLTFGLVKKEIWIVPLKAMYFYSYIIYFLMWPLIFQFVLRPLIRKSGAHKKRQTAADDHPNQQQNHRLTLSRSEWLNDEVINFFLNLIVERNASDPHLPKVYTFNTFFYKRLREVGFSGVKRWTKKVNIFDYQMLLVPIHLGNHWCMAIVDFDQHRIDYYDSLFGENLQCLNLLRKYLAEESMDKRKQQFETNDWTLICRKDIPRQMNMDDCGIFACLFAEYASRRAPITFNQQHIQYFRMNMDREIRQKKLLG